jgi:AI-2 transport protein TqsA
VIFDTENYVLKNLIFFIVKEKYCSLFYPKIGILSMDPKEKIYSQFGIKFWIISASIIVVIAGMKEAAGLITPFFLSLLLTAIFYGPFKWLQKKGLPTMLALLIVILGIAFLTFTIFTLIGASVVSFTQKIPFYEERFTLYWDGLNQFLQDSGWLELDLEFSEYLNLSIVMKLVGNVFTSFGSIMSNFFILLLIVIFMLLEISIFEEKMKLIDSSSLGRVNKIVQNINAYFGTKALTSLVTGVLVSISLAIIGIDFPFLWGFLAFLLNFIPNIGSIIAAVPAILLALVQSGLPSAIAVVVVFLVINVIIGNIVEPRLMGKNLGLSPLIVFISLIFWGWVLGTIGMLLATPLTMTIKIVFDNMEETKHLGLMMGDESSIKNYTNQNETSD